MGNFMLYPYYESGQEKHRTSGESGFVAAASRHPPASLGSAWLPLGQRKLFSEKVDNVILSNPSRCTDGETRALRAQMNGQP